MKIEEEVEHDTQFDALVKLLLLHRTEALALLPKCQPESTGYFWCCGRIDAVEHVLLNVGVSLDD
jgi:hypothetical protein